MRPSTVTNGGFEKLDIHTEMRLSTDEKAGGGGTIRDVDVTDWQAPLAVRGLIDVAYGAYDHVLGVLMLLPPSKVRLAAFVCRARRRAASDYEASPP